MGRKPTNKQRGYTSRWDRLSRQARATARYCAICSKPFTPDDPASTDHIDPIAEFGPRLPTPDRIRSCTEAATADEPGCWSSRPATRGRSSTRRRSSASLRLPGTDRNAGCGVSGRALAASGFGLISTTSRPRSSGPTVSYATSRAGVPPPASVSSIRKIELSPFRVEKRAVANPRFFPEPPARRACSAVFTATSAVTPRFGPLEAITSQPWLLPTVRTAPAGRAGRGGGASSTERSSRRRGGCGRSLRPVPRAGRSSSLGRASRSTATPRASRERFASVAGGSRRDNRLVDAERHELGATP
jgi:hypothetical protein